MTDKKYKLTISILASNRKDTLPKTLESVKPILENVSSELIVTDTGCDDELIDVIRQYTDKIVKFQWCNDFSKARNVGLKMAQGQWFMFLDDDEWFEDVTPIIEFFNTKECEKYNVIHYLVRNYGDFEGKTWLDAVVERGIRLVEGVEFVDTIHEHFSVNKPPIKLLNCFVHHYGYVYKTDEDKRKHFERNYELLMANLEREPHVSRHYTHLIKGFNNQQEYEKSLELAWKALECVDLKNEENFRDVSAFYADIVFCEFNLDRLEAAVVHGEDFLEHRNISELSQCMIHALLANAYLMIREDEKAIINLKKYFELYELLSVNLELRMSQSTAVVALAFSWNMFNRTWYFGLCKAALMDDEELLIYIMDKKKYLTHVQSPNENRWQGRLIAMMRKSQYKERYADTILAIMDEPLVATTICGELLKLKEENEASFLEIAGLLVDNESDNSFIKALRAIYCGMCGIKEVRDKVKVLDKEVPCEEMQDKDEHVKKEVLIEEERAIEEDESAEKRIAKKGIAEIKKCTVDEQCITVEQDEKCEKDEEDELEDYLRNLDMSVTYEQEEIQACIKRATEMMINSCNIVKMSSIAGLILKSGQHRDVFIHVLKQLEKQSRQIFDKLADIIAMTDSEDAYADYMRIISARDDMYKYDIEAYYEHVISSDYNIFEFDNRFLNIAYKKNIDLNAILEKIPLDIWMKNADMWISRAKVKDIVEKDELLSSLLSKESLYRKYVDCIISEGMLIRRKLEGITKEKLEAVLLEYSKKVVSFYENIYEDVIFMEYKTLLPARCQAAILISKMCEKNEHHLDIKYEMEEMLKLNPSLKAIVYKYEELV